MTMKLRSQRPSMDVEVPQWRQKLVQSVAAKNVAGGSGDDTWSIGGWTLSLAT